MEALVALGLAVVLLMLLVVKVGLLAYVFPPMLQHTRRTYEQLDPGQRRRAVALTVAGCFVGIGLAVGLATGSRAVVIGLAASFALLGIVGTPLAIWLDRRSV